MRKLLSMLLLCLGIQTGWADSTAKKTGAAYEPQEGDIVFQSLPNGWGMDLVDAIEGSTHSPYSHCGMVFQTSGAWMVIEAIGPVQHTPLAEWIARGRKKKVWAYRLAEDQKKFIPTALAAMNKDLGKPYDPRYRFDDDAIYCSELIWRGWKAATGHGLGKTVKLGELDWQPYRKLIERIEGTTTIPVDREMITPRDLAAARELTQVYPLP
ncbi:hypothetical protein KBB96_12665 [Luteolibacter ambystomatis]|uniref:YiiX family permuted papain-like enzyme n=1 Tax=Luteolibacter ambystomatis TaxID=2824561 RepID=A0A975G5J1_9BACT|nr:YiiX/YebB-like N1pC/P60 family cysteine hydrolase [Luteolibacter ambystomatis]QUE49722.1 hypothetical protein KBB96_12665 [Luteolibacter ambystomatis]